MRFIFLFTILVLAMAAGGSAACVCTAEYRPVCATNGRTYSNRCSMNCAKAKFQYDGKCGGRG